MKSNKGFINFPVAEIIDKLWKRRISAQEIIQLCFDRIEDLDPTLRAWVVLDRKMASAAAHESQQRIDQKIDMRLLESIPVGVKDIFNTAKFPTQMGSPLWKGFTPGNDARAVFYCRIEGAIIPGKTDTAEFAVHTPGTAINPHDANRATGTSSSGSAVAVATGMVPYSLGTQTAGSIVRPASFCGVYGFKPSFGLIPRTGMLKTTDSLDSVGYFSCNYEDALRFFEVIRVHGPNFPYSHAAFGDETRRTKTGKKTWRVCFAETHTWKYVPDYAQEMVQDCIAGLNALKQVDVIERRLPLKMNRAHEVHRTIYNRTLAYYFKEEFKRNELVSPIMNELIGEGNRIQVPVYQDALHEQEELIQTMDRFFEGTDILISLSTAGAAPPRGDLEEPDPALMWTMTHLPVVSVPQFISPDGLPFGMQVVARKYNDYQLFDFLDYLRNEGFIPAGPNPVVER